jgi:hypothetical protein
MRELSVFLSLSAANLFVQFFTSESYTVALERSYWEGIALLTYWICKKIDERTTL